MNENENTKAACDAQPSNTEASAPAYGPAVHAEDRYLSQFSGQRDKDLARNLSGLSAVFGAVDRHRCTAQAEYVPTLDSFEQLNGFHHAISGLLAYSKDLIEQPQEPAPSTYLDFAINVASAVDEAIRTADDSDVAAAMLKRGIRTRKTPAKKKPAAKVAKAAKATKVKKSKARGR